MIYKRLSVRKFDPELELTDAELNGILEKLSQTKALYPEIKTAYRIVKASDTNVKFGKYVLIVYSEEKTGYLVNAGYIVEELDLWLAEKNIGGCWYGMGRPTEEQKEYDGCKYVIMYTFGKCREDDFRHGEDEFNRKALGDLWWGDVALDAASAARLAPSACNSQPWLVKCDGDADGDILTVYRKRNFVTKLAKTLNLYFNVIDSGIFLKILEISLENFGYAYERELLSGDEDKNLSYVAKYKLIKKETEK